ncbi:MAG TPA: BTAD domain-containing putative transcriptional regulator [Acidimicrobiales bacterium]
MRDGLEVGLLGPVVVVPAAPGAAPRHLRGHAARLLAWLALQPGRAWSADDLAQRLWPSGPPATARTAIHGHVSRLRRTLGPGAAVRIDTVPGGYALRVTAPQGDAGRSPVDAHRFRALRERAARARADDRPREAADLLVDALGLWRGDALADLRADPALAAQADAIDGERRDAEDGLADALVAAGDTDRALALLGRLVNDDPLRERRWALLMVALTRAGRQTDALRAYRRAAAVLVERTGLDPGHELRRLETAILLQDPSLDAARWQPAPGCAPVPLAHVVGRDAARAAAVSRLGASRLVTLVGPGGVGKTTLALDVGAAMAGTFADGAVVVDLGAVGPDDVGAAAAAAVAAPPPDASAAADDALARAAAALAGREVLVVLDGCEDVRGEAARAAVELLRAGPAVTILATSQVPLGVAGEAVVRLEPLELPPGSADVAALRRSPAVELLARRLDELGCPVQGHDAWRHAAAVARALDGLPLAIEIAATAARTEPLADLADRLTDDAGPLLDAEPPAGIARRRLGDTLDAAVDRLDPEAARVYAHLGLFPAGCAATAVAATAAIAEQAAAAAITRLTEASLVALDTDRRWARLLQPVRAHAAARLASSGESGAAHDRLVAWCLTEAEALERASHGPGEADVVERFVAELPTFRAVLRHLLDRDEVGRAARLFSQLAPTWNRSPASQEVQGWADELLARAEGLPDGDRARLEVAAIHAQYAFELIAARLDLAEAALARAEAAGDRVVAALGRTQVAIGLGWRNTDLDRAARLLDEARETLLELGEPYWAAVVQEVRGLLALRRLDIATGLDLLTGAAGEHRAHGGPSDVGHALTFIGYGRRAVGDLAGARRAFEEARRALGAVQPRTWLRATIGAAHAALALGDLDGAGEAFRAAHDRAVEIGDARIVGTALVGLASIARARSDTDRCVALLAGATDRALAGGDPTDAVSAAAVLGEMLVTVGAPDEGAVLVGAASLVEDEVGVRVDFGLARDLGPVRAALDERLGPDRARSLAADGRAIGLSAAVRRGAARLLGEGTGQFTGVADVADAPGSGGEVGASPVPGPPR